jgi:hypothetical protein
MGQHRSASLRLESVLNRYLFCGEIREGFGLQAPSGGNLWHQIAPGFVGLVILVKLPGKPIHYL